MYKIILPIAIFLVSLSTQASGLSFNNLTSDDVTVIAEDFSTMFGHTAVSSARSAGSLLGFEVSLVGGLAQVPGVEDIAKRVDPSTEFEYAPFAMLNGAMKLPQAFTLEANFLPEMDLGDLTVQHYSAGLKWVPTDKILAGLLPIDLAVRTYVTKSEISFSQTVSSQAFNVGYKNILMGVEALGSIDLLFVEPFAGLGYVTGSGELTAESPSNPGASIFTSGAGSEKADVSSMKMIAGLQFNMLLMKFALEYNRVFDNNRIAAKIGASF